MILSGLKIKEEMGKNIFIYPFSERQLGPNSYNLKLFNELLIYESAILDMKIPNEFKTIMSLSQN
jgi:dCTP deaminase